MSHGYNSGTAFSKAVTEINGEAAILLDRLDGIRQLQDEKTRSLIFVAHSLGGIVVKKALILAQERPKAYGKLLESVKGIVFFGVPHRGSEVAYWGSFVANVMAISQLGFRTNTKFVDAPRRNSRLFSDISQQFAEPGSQLNIRSFYETEKLYGKLIVTKDSACLGLPNEMAVGIASANHRTMCRFKDINSQKYFRVWTAIKSLVKSATTDLHDYIMCSSPRF